MLNAFEPWSHKLIPIAVVAMVLYAASARADDSDTSMFSFSGFGTVGETHSSERQADFTPTRFDANGPGYTSPWSANIDSLIAAQVTANFTSQLSAVVQVVSQQNYDNTYTPHVEWANIKYEFTPDFSVRVGRTVLPLFMEADTRDIGYSNLWVRPPVEVYKLVPIDSSDGVDVSYRMPLGAAINTFQVVMGQTNANFSINGNTGAAQPRKIVDFSDNLEYGFATVSLRYWQANVTIATFDPLLDAFGQFGPEGIAIANKYRVNGRMFSNLNIGAIYDPGNWVVMGEWDRFDGDSAIGNNTAWYASGGYRLGKFTPYVTYAQVKADSDLSAPGLTVSGLPTYLVGPASGLNAALNSILASTADQQTISIGGRWDFMRNADLKLQFDHTHIGAGSSGTLSNIQPGFQLGSRFNLLSATFDFVF